MLFADSKIATVGITAGFTVMVIILLVVVAGQILNEVILTVTLSAFASVADENVGLVAPETSTH